MTGDERKKKEEKMKNFVEISGGVYGYPSGEPGTCAPCGKRTFGMEDFTIGQFRGELERWMEMPIYYPRDGKLKPTRRFLDPYIKFSYMGRENEGIIDGIVGVKKVKKIVDFLLTGKIDALFSDFLFNTKKWQNNEKFIKIEKEKANKRCL